MDQCHRAHAALRRFLNGRDRWDAKQVSRLLVAVESGCWTLLGRVRTIAAARAALGASRAVWSGLASHRMLAT
jgi:hypothetical protein